MILVHGGAGNVAPDRHDRLRAGVRHAAAIGRGLLDRGSSALDAVVAAVRILEDDPEFNAGTGSALTRDGTVEVDAAVMDGKTRRVGAVGAVPNVATPIILARAILERGEHVMLAGPAALGFAQEIGLSPAAPGALVTPRALQRFREMQAKGGTASGSGKADQPEENDGGTVGAVARDKQGGLAVATSTGGLVYKRPGRIGDSPVPGAGTWADDKVAISATGDGEAILRMALAKDIAMRVHDGAGIRSAAKTALQQLQKVTGGNAGVIVVDGNSWCALQTSSTMPVAWIDDFGPNDAIGFEL